MFSMKRGPMDLEWMRTGTKEIAKHAIMRNLKFASIMMKRFGELGERLNKFGTVKMRFVCNRGR